MKPNHLSYILLLLCGLLAAGCSAPDNSSASSSAATPAPTANAAMENGKKLFEEKCQLCHGADGTAGLAGAANLQTSKLDTLQTIGIVTAGKKAMPPFREQLGTGEIEQITQYVFSLRK